jgi:hypothetical protein
MRRWIAAPLLLTGLLALVGDDAPPAQAQQPAAPVAETFVTADGVKLHGLFHRSPKPQAGNPVVLFLYPPGPANSMTKPGDWDGLATTLTKEGFHVFRFDWRGHGKSTDIVDTMLFWQNPYTGGWNNQLIKGANKKPVKNDLFVNKDFTAQNLARYFPCFVNDLAAVRLHLDTKNDAGDLNSGSIYVIAANDAATLGMLWLTTEWVRPAIHPTLPGGIQYPAVPTQGIVVNPEAGRDVAALITLSGSRHPSVAPGTAQGWVRNTLKMRENNPMLLLYGPEDKKSKAAAEFFYDDVLVAKGNMRIGVQPLPQTFLKPLDGAKALNGVALLGNNATLKTEDTIVKYMAAIQKERAALVVKQRKYSAPYFVDLRYFGLQ